MELTNKEYWEKPASVNAQINKIQADIEDINKEIKDEIKTIANMDVTKDSNYGIEDYGYNPIRVSL